MKEFLIVILFLSIALALHVLEFWADEALLQALVTIAILMWEYESYKNNYD